MEVVWHAWFGDAICEEFWRQEEEAWKWDVWTICILCWVVKLSVVAGIAVEKVQWSDVQEHPLRDPFPNLVLHADCAGGLGCVPVSYERAILSSQLFIPAVRGEGTR